MTIKERPILFSSPMVRAILEDRKTMTRRIIKLIPDTTHDGEPYWYIGGYRVWPYRDTTDPLRMDGKMLGCPYGNVGDRLWVRETWATSLCCDNRPPRETASHGLPFWYNADDSVVFTGATTGGPSFMGKGKNRPSIHMPRWASRINLGITGVRVERLNAISEEDAKAEGAEPSVYSWPEGTSAASAMDCNGLHRNGFRNLWEKINGVGSWNENPWVFVISFGRI